MSPVPPVVGVVKGNRCAHGPSRGVLRAARLGRHRVRAQTVEVHDGIVEKDVVPGTDVVHRNIDVAMLTLDVDWPPVGAIVGVRQVIAQISEVSASNSAHCMSGKRIYASVVSGLPKLIERSRSGRSLGHNSSLMPSRSMVLRTMKMA